MFKNLAFRPEVKLAGIHITICLYFVMLLCLSPMVEINETVLVLVLNSNMDNLTHKINRGC